MSEPNDSDWLLARERGDDVSHVPAATRAIYDRLAALIKELPGQAPSPGWKQQVLDALDDLPEHHGPPSGPAPEPPRAPQAPQAPTSPAAIHPQGAQWHDAAIRGRATWMITGGAFASAATALVLVLAIRTTDEGVPAPFATMASVTIRRSGGVHRSHGVNIGDTLVVEAQADRSIELRVYGDAGEPLARCNEATGCALGRSGGQRRFRLELALAAPGDVRTVLFIGDPIPPPSRDLASDLEAAERANVETRNLSCIHVQ